MATAMREWRCSAGDKATLGFCAVLLFAMAGFLAIGLVAISPTAVPVAVVIIFALLALGVLILAVAIALSLAAIACTRIAVDESRIDLIVPTWRSSLASPPMRRLGFAPEEIGAVETREEVRRWFGTTVIRPTLWLTTTTGERVLVYRFLPDKPGKLPIDDIAAAIGAAAGHKVIEHGLVEVGPYLGGATDFAAPSLTPRAAAATKSAAARYATIVAALFAVVFALRACLSLLNN